MKIKFSLYERVAGIFVFAALMGALVMTVSMAIQKGWFAAKVEFQTVVDNADGLHAGTVVQISGLRAGSVNEVELVSANEIHVRFEVLKKFHERVRKDSKIQVIRPFVIGEKVLDLSVGSDEFSQVIAGERVETIESFDMMDLVSGRKLGPFMQNMEGLMVNLKALVEAFADKKRTESFVKMFDKLEPLIHNVNWMARGMGSLADTATKKNRMEKIVGGLAAVGAEVQADPEFAKQIPKLVHNISELTEEFKKLTPAITAIAPELPRASKRAIEALDEAVITLKAMQKSFMLKGSVEEVLEEEAKANKRQPANKR